MKTKFQIGTVIVTTRGPFQILKNSVANCDEGTLYVVKNLNTGNKALILDDGENIFFIGSEMKI